jgi:predicted outer membrane repeat protein
MYPERLSIRFGPPTIRPYQVVGNILVAGLKIRPGVSVLFAGNYVFEVAGRLTAVGTDQMPIVFTRTNSAGGWRGIYFNNAGPGSELENCTISNATGSALRIEASPAPTIVKCAFSNNSSTNGGGAINASGTVGDLVIDACKFTANSTLADGGAIRAKMTSGALRILNGCRFVANIANPNEIDGDHVGGAVYASGRVVISDAMFSLNTSISACTSVYNCDVTGRGGAIYLDSSLDSTIENSVFVSNTVRSVNRGYCLFGGNSMPRGGAVYLQDGSLSIHNTVLSQNGAAASGCGPSQSGAALFVSSGSCTAVNVTCAYNSQSGTAGGIQVGGGKVAITNSIIYFNGGTQINGPATVAYSDIQGGFAGVGNISGNPIFLSENDLMIVPGSPCIDAGSTNIVYNDICFPPSLRKSTLGGARNDMGAHGGPGACPGLLPRLGLVVNVTLLGGVPGYGYRLQTSSDFLNWSTPAEQISVLHIGDTVGFTDPLTNSLPYRFYRLNVAP